MPRTALVALLLLLPAYAGCLGEEEAPAAGSSGVAKSAAEAGAVAGEAPVAATEAYAVEDAVAYPLAVATNPARPPVVLDLSDAFSPADCRPFRMGDLEAVLQAASRPGRGHDLSESIRVGDVFSYDITLAYTNAADNWGEIHAAYGLGSTVQEHSESTQAMTDVVISWSGQGFRATEEDMAWVFVGCYYGSMTRPIPYTLTVTLTFAEGAIPAEAPLLVPVPQGATKLFVTGVPIDGSKGVLSHFRLFGPDDALVCECTLSSKDTTTTVDLPVPGEYVILVDHTDNGFVAAALDVPSDEPVRALASEWVETLLLAHDHGPVDETLQVDLPRVPLLMHAFVVGKEGAGVGKRTQLEVTNARGTPLRIGWGGHLTWDMPDGRPWLGFWPGDWAHEVDHHAFAPGGHTVHITAEDLRGEVFLLTRQYVR